MTLQPAKPDSVIQAGIGGVLGYAKPGSGMQIGIDEALG